MKKIIKNPIFSFILGALIFGGIAGVSAFTILAKDIKYVPSDTSWKVDNISDAIDELYKNENSSTNFSTFTGTIYVSAYQGTSHLSYVDIDTSNYKNLKLTITFIDEANTICNVQANDNIIQSIPGEGTYNVDVSSFSKIRIYYRQVVGYDHVIGTYELSN